MNEEKLSSPEDNVNKAHLEWARDAARFFKRGWLVWPDRDGSTKSGADHEANYRASELACWPDKTVIWIEPSTGRSFYRCSVMRGPLAIMQTAHLRARQHKGLT